jgi:hypothetical protein
MKISGGGLQGAALLGTAGLTGGLLYRFNRTSKRLEDSGAIKEGRDFTRGSLTGYDYRATPKGQKIFIKELAKDNKERHPIAYLPGAIGLYGGATVGYLLGSKYF